MPYCNNCGTQINDGAKFCPECGAKNEVGTTNTSQRKTVYDGEIHKCPSCGENLKSFTANCPSCGYEIRRIDKSNPVQELATKLEDTKTEKRKMEIIKNFPIPNTKEDIFEFMLLAKANFDIDEHIKNLDRVDVSDAWLAKMEQCYEKAKISLSNQSDLLKIREMYENIKTECARRKQKQRKNTIIISIVVPICLLLMIGIPLLCAGLSGAFDPDPNLIKVGISSKDAKGQYYTDIVELFEKQGFINVEARADGRNPFKKADTVKKITIDGEDDFTADTKFNKNAKVIIFYYGKKGE